MVFLNTDGGTLRVGVDDAGAFVGITADRFENEGKYGLHINNGFKENIGRGCVACIRYDPNEVGGQRVLVINGRPSSQPAAAN